MNFEPRVKFEEEDLLEFYSQNDLMTVSWFAFSSIHDISISGESWKKLHSMNYFLAGIDQQVPIRKFIEFINDRTSKLSKKYSSLLYRVGGLERKVNKESELLRDVLGALTTVSSLYINALPLPDEIKGLLHTDEKEGLFERVFKLPRWMRFFSYLNDNYYELPKKMESSDEIKVRLISFYGKLKALEEFYSNESVAFVEDELLNTYRQDFFNHFNHYFRTDEN